MYPVSLGSFFQVSQTVSTSFDGTEVGRAGLTLDNGDNDASSEVTVRALTYGLTANSLTVAFVDTGMGTSSSLRVSQVGPAISVQLARTVEGITSTAADVAAALNAASVSFPGAAQAIRATYGGDGTSVVIAHAATALSGGFDPRIDPSGTRFDWTYPSDVNGGLFFFENTTDAVLVRDIQASFPSIGGGTLHMRFSRVDLDAGLNVIQGSDIPVFEADFTSSNFAVGLSDVRIPLLPYQALQAAWTVGSAAGTVRIIACRDARFPYL